MSNQALYDVLQSYKDIHKIVLGLADSLSDEQIRWKPENYSTSIGFHLWHLARESDYLKAATLSYFPAVAPEGAVAAQIWHEEKLAEKWGFPADLGETGVGTGISDETAASLPIPPRADLLDYLRRSYAAIEEYIEWLDHCYPNFDNVDESLQKMVAIIRMNLLVFLMHDSRHLGMMECLKGLQTGFGSATEQRG